MPVFAVVYVVLGQPLNQTDGLDIPNCLNSQMKNTDKKYIVWTEYSEANCLGHQ